MPGPLSRTATRSAGWPSSSAAARADVDLDGGRAGGQGVIQDVAEDLSEAKRVADAARGRRPPISSRRTACLSLRALLEMGPASRQIIAQVAGGLLELDRGRVAADILVEVMEVVLRLLKPGDQVEGFGPVPDGQGEHLQAGLAALQGVAALVRQAGDHLADGGQSLGLKRPLLGLLEIR